MFALGLLASVMDLRSRRVPNWLTVTGTLFGITSAALYAGLAGVLASIAGALVALFLLLPGFALGFTGGGDVKLFAAFGAFLGIGYLANALVIYLMAALLVICLLLVRSALKRESALPFRRYLLMLRCLFATGRAAYVPPVQGEVMGRRLPMAPVIAGAAVLAPWASSLAPWSPWTP